MILDSSAIIAILWDEEDAEDFSRRIAAAADCKISAANYVESAAVIDGRRGTTASRDFDSYFQNGRIAIMPVTEEQARLARDAYRRYGKGSGHPAKLNFGDCFAYALAKASGEPLLFKGRDFAHTDVASALD